MKLLVPVSYFNGTPRSEIHRIDCDSGAIEHWLTLPKSGREVRGKGITGLQQLNKDAWVGCDFNRVFVLDVRGRILRVTEPEDANDLHQLSFIDGLIYLANTGRDSVDVLNTELKLVARYDGLSNAEWHDRLNGNYTIDSTYYDPPECALPFHLRRLPDKWHFNHVTQLPVALGGHIAVTSFSKRAIYDATTLCQISNTLPAPPHDGVVHAGKIWVSTVSGGVYVAPVTLPWRFTKLLDLAGLVAHLGWCRGLAFARDKMFVGVTAVPSDSDYVHCVPARPEETRSGVYQLNVTTFAVEHFYDFTHADGARIFSIALETDDDAK